MNARSSIRAALAGMLLTLAAACDRAPAEPTPEALRVSEIVLEDASGGVYYSHRDHWHGAPPLTVGQAVPLTLWFVADTPVGDDHEAAPRTQWFSLSTEPDYDVRVVVEDPTVATWSGDRGTGALTGLRDASSRVSFVVRRAGATIYESPPLTFRVRP